MLNSIYDYFEHITEFSRRQLESSKLLERYCCECDYAKLISTAENSLRMCSDTFFAYRELLLLLYGAVPSIPHADAEDIQSEAFGVSVEALARPGFSVYRISLPFLLPNKSRRCTDFKNALTVTVGDAVRRFCFENDIRPFDRASVFFVSYYSPESPSVTIVNNDNKEGSVIQNALIGCLLRDDQATVNDTYYCSKIIADGSPKTEIYIVGSEHDVEVLTFIKSL